MFWIYDIPTWQLGVSIVTLFVAVSIGGLYLSRGYIKNHFGLSDLSNRGGVNGYNANVGGLFRLLLGLVAVATWQDYNSASTLVSREASAISVFYQDISSYPEPYKTELQNRLKTYVHFVVDSEWPAQSKGQRVHGGRQILLGLQNTLLELRPDTARDKVAQSQGFAAYNRLVEARRMRLDSVDSGLPAVLWIVVFSGAILSMFVTYFYHFSHFRTHVVLTAVMAVFSGLVVFLTAAVDNPFRGEVSVSSAPYQLLLETWEVYR
ncbi:DUF4239 domain-containing protein [Candidatus Methylospira mobilis]|uniref:DUF4239 domain-containing protein n=1 Tax=Candidatus Methylospira mobilis TaxID=1808979 RepID=A0A5Q0BRF0_9GAMM|nr:DUF4239 domain-containing protein [Candidatus Methylospira mobilis]QFY44774.1 DUF4239 domain-containing protein [Candidatus Methylospira mobilis]WNV05685.1 DUF4239 domain-containing protein [Candidatus Methylospira mobilis]